MRKWSVWLALMGVMVAVLLVYSNHFHNSFHFDDEHTILNNTYVQHIGNIPLFFEDGKTSSSVPSNQSYRPLLTTTLAIDYHFCSEPTDAFPFHITSFAFFILLGIVMFVLFRSILHTSSPGAYTDWVALFAVSWFMLHPACAETINYIIQRGDSLSTFFVALALALYAASPFCRKYFIYLIPAVAGILTKPSALMFAPLLLCYIVLFEAGTGFRSMFTGKKKVLSKILLSSLAAFVICIGGYALVSVMQPPNYTEGGASADMYRLTQPFILAYYFSAWFAPVHLTVDTDWAAFTSAADPYALLGYLFLILVIVAIFFTSEKKAMRPIAFGLSWFLIACIPTSIISFSEITNDHRMFFPFVGLSLAVTWTLYLLLSFVFRNITVTPAMRGGLAAVLIVILAGYAYGTHERNKVWLSDETLWRDCTIKSPKNGRAMMGYGVALMHKGDLAGAENYFTQGLQILPNYAYLDLNMGIVKHAQGKLNEVDKYLKASVDNGGTTCPSCYFYYALFLSDNGKRKEAIDLLYIVYNNAAAHQGCRELLMELLYNERRIDELKKIVDATMQAFPGDPKATEYQKLIASGTMPSASGSAAYAQTPDDFIKSSEKAYLAGDYQGCIDNAQKALAIRPDIAMAYNNMGAAYNMLGKYKEAKESLLKALQLVPDFKLAKDNLTFAEAHLNQPVK